MQQTRNAVMTAYMLVILGLVALSTATYAWMGVSRIPFISDVTVNVMTKNGISIAPDEGGRPGEWDYFLDASEFFQDLVPLRPVTYVDDWFSHITYDSTGRTAGVVPVTEDQLNVRYPSGDRSSSEAREAEQRGYMVAYDFWLRTDGTPADVMLSPPRETVDGQMGGGTYAVGAPVWDDGTVSHENGGYGSETTLRMGFRSRYADANADLTGEETFAIYEPNADIHVDGSTGYIETPSVNGGPLIDSAHHIIQNASTWEEQTPVLQDVVVYTVGDFVQNTELLHLPANGMAKVTLYLWMEGQDIDCLARGVARAASIVANIQFGASGESMDTGISRG